MRVVVFLSAAKDLARAESRRHRILRCAQDDKLIPASAGLRDAVHDADFRSAAYGSTQSQVQNGDGRSRWNELEATTWIDGRQYEGRSACQRRSDCIRDAGATQFAESVAGVEKNGAARRPGIESRGRVGEVAIDDPPPTTEHAAGVAVQQARRAQKQRRLSGSARTTDEEHLGATNLDRDVVERRDARRTVTRAGAV